MQDDNKKLKVGQGCRRTMYYLCCFSANLKLFQNEFFFKHQQQKQLTKQAHKALASTAQNRSTGVHNDLNKINL